MKKISKLFPLKDRGGVASCEECIVEFVRTGRMDTHVGQ